MADQLRKKKQYPPSVPAATLWSAEHYPLAKRRMPVLPLIRLSGVDHLPHQPHHEPRRRPQTPPPAYTGALPPRYEEVAYYSDDDEPLAFLQQRKIDSADDESPDDHETLACLQQRLSTASV